MAKDAFWFKHDSNSRTDVKMVKLRRKSGLEGVGLFWCVVEMLRESENYELELGCSDDIIYDLRTTESVFESLFECELLSRDENVFYSESLKDRMTGMDKVREKRRLAGSKGGKAKASAKKIVANAKAMPKQKSSNALAHPSEESRVEENKEEKNKETTPQNEKSAVVISFWNNTFSTKTKVDKALENELVRKINEYGMQEVKRIVTDYHKYYNGEEYWINTPQTLKGQLFGKIFHATEESMKITLKAGEEEPF